MSPRLRVGLRLSGALWVLGISLAGATLALSPIAFILPVALLSLVLWRPVVASRWHRARAVAAYVALWLFAAVASATIGVFYLPGLLTLGVAQPWSDSGNGAPNNTLHPAGAPDVPVPSPAPKR
ncbi:MAG: hypothetical protein IPK85_04580 [Gemmatimonadetes bacterium]|nr:hypothetical protein [Gemmatimonadota bacterium]